jgi:hypothetical protein
MLTRAAALPALGLIIRYEEVAFASVTSDFFLFR